MEWLFASLMLLPPFDGRISHTWFYALRECLYGFIVTVIHEKLNSFRTVFPKENEYLLISRKPRFIWWYMPYYFNRKGIMQNENIRCLEFLWWNGILRNLVSLWSKNTTSFHSFLYEIIKDLKIMGTLY